jgi:hypothetical protein
MTIPSPFSLFCIPNYFFSSQGFSMTVIGKTIALGGMVVGSSIINLHPAMNLVFNCGDSYSGVSLQVFHAIKSGFMSQWIGVKHEPVNIYINNNNPDTVLALWMILNYERIEGPKNSEDLEKLLMLINNWTVSNGAFPQDMNALIVKKHAWIFKNSGMLRGITEVELLSKTKEVLDRIDAYILGSTETLIPNTQFITLRKNEDLVFISKEGPYARPLLFAEGVKVLASLKEELGESRYLWEICFKSQHSRFPASEIVKLLNLIDGCMSDAASRDRWSIQRNSIHSPQKGSSVEFDYLDDIMSQQMSLVRV